MGTADHWSFAWSADLVDEEEGSVDIAVSLAIVY
jgi:hypothetical protein